MIIIILVYHHNNNNNNNDNNDNNNNNNSSSSSNSNGKHIDSTETESARCSATTRTVRNSKSATTNLLAAFQVSPGRMC
jgi:hypothetical protein